QTILPIRLGQKVKVCLNNKDIFITIQTGFGNTVLLPAFCCQSGTYIATETSLQKQFLIIGVSLHEKWCYAGPGFQVSLIHQYKKTSIFILQIDDKKCIIEIYQESTLTEQFIGNMPNK
ncbi:535_t:CDS:2, partial [Gigaspora rosea]